MTKHILYCPFTGLGLYNGFRGNRWLKNRIQIFKQFVIPNLIQQTNQDFILWISWRREEKNNPIVKEFISDLVTDQYRTIDKYHDERIYRIRIIHTFTGVCFYDDKYEDKIARERLMMSLHGAMPDLMEAIGDCDEVILTIQPSDDIYHLKALDAIQGFFRKFPEGQAVGFNKGYICNYLTKEVKNYDPQTNPPFYSIRFTRKQFTGLPDHTIYTSLKKDVGKYKVGTPLPSHEYLVDVFPGRYATINDRGFVVGCHFDNISTNFQIPYAGESVDNSVLKDFGIFDTNVLKVKFSLRKKFFNSLPHKVKRKLRFWAGEKKWILRPLFSVAYNFLKG